MRLEEAFRGLPPPPEDPQDTLIKRIIPILMQKEGGDEWDPNHPQAASGAQAYGRLGIVGKQWFPKFPQYHLNPDNPDDIAKFRKSPALQLALGMDILRTGMKEVGGDPRKIGAWWYGGLGGVQKLGTGREFEPEHATNAAGEDIVMPSVGEYHQDYNKRLRAAGIDPVAESRAKAFRGLPPPESDPLDLEAMNEPSSPAPAPQPKNLADILGVQAGATPDQIKQAMAKEPDVPYRGPAEANQSAPWLIKQPEAPPTPTPWEAAQSYNPLQALPPAPPEKQYAPTTPPTVDYSAGALNVPPQMGGFQPGKIDINTRQPLPGELPAADATALTALQQPMQGNSPALAEAITQQANPPSMPTLGEYSAARDENLLNPTIPLHSAEQEARARAEYNVVDPKVAGFGKAALGGLTAGTYQPNISPEENGVMAKAGGIAGSLGGGLLAGVGGPSAIAAFGWLTYLNDLKSRGLDPQRLSDPEIQAMAAASGIAMEALPPSLRGGALKRLVTGAGLGAGQNVIEDEVAAEITKTDPETLYSALTGGAFGAAFGLSYHSSPTIRKALEQKLTPEQMQTLSAGQAEGKAGIQIDPNAGAENLQKGRLSMEEFQKSLSDAGWTPDQIQKAVVMREAAEKRNAYNLAGADPFTIDVKGATEQTPPSAPNFVLHGEPYRGGGDNDPHLSDMPPDPALPPPSAPPDPRDAYLEAIKTGQEVPEPILASNPDLRALHDLREHLVKPKEGNRVDYTPAEVESWEAGLDRADFLDETSAKKSSSEITEPFIDKSQASTAGSPAKDLTETPPPGSETIATGRPSNEKNILPPAGAKARGSKTLEGMPKKVRPGKGKSKPQEASDVLHVGETAKNVLRVWVKGKPINAISIHPDDLPRLGLMKGEAHVPMRMSPNEMWKIMGLPVRVDPAAPRLQAIADHLNLKEGGEAAQVPHIGGERSGDIYHADNIAQALINRPRNREALLAEIQAHRDKANGVQSAREEIKGLPPAEESAPGPTAKPGRAVPEPEVSPLGTNEDEILFQRDNTPKTSQEDMFGNKGRVASQGFIKGKVPDKGLEGTPMDLAGKADEQARADEDQQKLFQHQAQTETPAFRSWFGDSKVVDRDGKPLTVYHGTTGDFSSFDPQMRGRVTQGEGAKKGFFFIDRADVASSYSHVFSGREALELKTRMEKEANPGAKEDLKREYEKKQEEDRRAKTAPGANVMPAYLSIKNPRVFDFEGHEWQDGRMKSEMDLARTNGNDGVIFRNIQDDPDLPGNRKGTVYVAFHPEQIKSATGNRGTFDPRSSNILEQGPKGSLHYDNAIKKWVITLVKGKANFSTFFHEYFHYLEQAKVISETDRADLTRALNAAGIEKPMNDKGTFTPEAAEKTARWFERWLRDGVAPKGLAAVFEKIKQYMREVYQSVRANSPIAERPPKGAEEVFRRLFGDEAPSQERTAKSEPAAGVLKQEDKPPLGEAPFKAAREKQFDTQSPPPGKGLGDAVTYDAEPGNITSGYLTPAQKGYSDYVNEAFPIEKIQTISDVEQGKKPGIFSDIRHAINRVLGAGSTANNFLEKNLKPIFQGGILNGIKYEKLTPEEGRLVDAYAIAKDHLERYDTDENFHNPKLTREAAARILGEHEKLDPKVKEKVEQAAQGLVDFAKDLAQRKLASGIWTEEEYHKYARFRNYIPDIRAWEKVASVSMNKRAKKAFTSTNRLIRGTHTSDLDPPIYDPVTALAHDARQFFTEAAKAEVVNKVVDLMQASPILKSWIEMKRSSEQKPLATQGEIKFLRNRETHLTEPQQAFAEKYQAARRLLDGGDEFTEDQKKSQLRSLHDKAEQYRRRNNKSAEDMHTILSHFSQQQEKLRADRMKEAEKLDAEFRKLPKEQRDLIQDWIDEGRVQTAFVPKELADAINGMGPIEWHGWQKPFIAAAGLFRKMQVAWNPAFIVSNFPRDVQEAYYNTGIKNPKWALKGFMHYVKKDAVYDAYMRAGGGMEGDESGFRPSSDMGKEIRYGDRFLADRYNKVKDKAAYADKKIVAMGKEWSMSTIARMADAAKETISIPFEASGHLSELGEMMSRLGVFDFAQNKLNMSEEEAIHLARQATLDFKRIGGKMKDWNAMIPFLNARIQGIDRTFRTMKHEPWAAASRLFLSAAMPATALLAWNSQNPNYADIPSWEKEYYWIIMMPDSKNYIKIAKGHVAQLVVNPFQMWAENAIGTAKKDPWKIAAGVLKSGLPVDDIGGTLNPAAKAIIEETAGEGGYDYYFDRDIVKNPERPTGYQYDPRTSEVLKIIGRNVNLSPARMQHVLQAIGGGTSTNLLWLADQGAALAGKAPQKKLGDQYVPLLSKFYGQTKEWDSDLTQKNRQVMKTIKDRKKAIQSFKFEIANTSRRGQKADMENIIAGMKKAVEELQAAAKQLKGLNDAMTANHKLKAALAAKLKLREEDYPAPSDATLEEPVAQ